MTGGDNALAKAFADVYDDVGDVDLWIGGLAEVHVGGGLVGETFRAIIIDQFNRTRDGDRFFFEMQLGHLQVLDPDFQSNNRLSDISRRNTSILNIQDDVFRIDSSTDVAEPSGIWLASVACWFPSSADLGPR